jgi:hypothetical protein
MNQDEPRNEAPERDEPNERENGPRLDDVIKSLPLLERDVYIGMQAVNLAIVDSMIEEMEGNLLAEYHRLERTPVPSVMVVSALSQLWIFGAYELLRTWRQRLQDVLSFADQLAGLGPEKVEERIANKETQLQDRSSDPIGSVPHGNAYRRAASDPEYCESLRTALYRSDLPFGRIEALRVHLAKHEVPKRRGLYGAAAGYSRIDYDGSIQFHVPLGDNEVEMVSRRQIADDVRRLADDRPLLVLGLDLQARVKTFSPSSYGIKRVILALRDGSRCEAHIAQNRHIVRVSGYEVPPFDGSFVVDVAEAPPDEAAPSRNKP